MKTRSLFNLILAALLLAACGGSAGTSSGPESDPSGPYAEIIDLANDVDAHESEPEDWSPASVGMYIQPGGEVWAKEASTARLGLDDSLVRVAPNTVFSFSQPDDQTTTIHLEEGQIWLNVEGLEEGEQFEVETPGATASVRGTRFSVTVKEDDVTVVSVVDGQVALTTATDEKLVGPGQEASASPGGMISEPVPMQREQQMLWGNAFGSNLDVALPSNGQSVCPQQFQGILVGDIFFDPTGQYATYKYQDPSQPSYVSGFTTIDLTTCAVSSEPPAFMDSSTYGTVYSPDLRRVFYTVFSSSGEKLCTSDPDGQNQTCFDTGENRTDLYYSYPSWSPDSSRVIFYVEYYNDSQSAIYTANPDGSGLVRVTPADNSVYTHGIFSPDGAHIAYLRSTGYADMYDAYAKTGNELWLANPDGTDPSLLSDQITGLPFLAWSPDGAWIAAAGEDEKVGLYSPLGEEALIVNSAGSSIYNLQWSHTPSGWPLLYTAEDKTTGSRGLYGLAGLGLSPAMILSDIRYGPYFSPTGNYALFSRRTTVDAEEDLYDSSIFIMPLYHQFLP